jgi:hypothetical protein
LYLAIVSPGTTVCAVFYFNRQSPDSASSDCATKTVCTKFIAHFIDKTTFLSSLSDYLRAWSGAEGPAHRSPARRGAIDSDTSEAELGRMSR